MRGIFTTMILLCMIFMVYSAKKKKKSKIKENLHEPLDEDEIKNLCYVNIRKLPKDHPVFIYPNSTEFIYPNRPFLHIYMTASEHIEMHCPGQRLFLGDTILSGFATMRCVGGVMFETETSVYSIETIECTGMIKSTVVSTNTACEPSGEYLNVGFRLSDGRFMNLYTVCFDSITRTTHGTYHILSQWANWSNLTANSNWWEGTFFNYTSKLRVLYSTTTQKESFNYLSGEPMQSTRFINTVTHLKKHRLVPQDDFVYKFQRIATNWFINVVPVWSHLTLFNWATIQRITRRYSSTKRIDLEIYAGVHERMVVANPTTKRDYEFFLEPKGQGIPVPKFIWKVVYDRRYQSGVVFIGLNNAHFRYPPGFSHFCEDVSKELGSSFPKGDTRQYNFEFGYVFACSIDNFRDIVPFIPKFPVKSLLQIP